MGTYKYQAEYDVYQLALGAGDVAMMDTLTANPDVWYPCGYSYVIIPTRGKFVTMLKDQASKEPNPRFSQYGYKSAVQPGWFISRVSTLQSQRYDANHAAASAFAEVLQKHRIAAEVESRVD